MRPTPRAFAALILIFLAACASVGLAPAQSFDQKLAYAYGSHTAVLEAAALAVRAGSLSRAEAQEVLNLADQSRALLDGARQLSATDSKTAGDKLALAAAVLTQLQAYLNSRGVK